MARDADNPIQVDVETDYVPAESDPEADRFVFSYTITISNAGERKARLLTRHWIITDGNGEKREVSGEGVIGEQPELAPGERFRYSSGAILETPVGTMTGHYGMEDSEGHRFRAPIGTFRLSVPGVLH